MTYKEKVRINRSIVEASNNLRTIIEELALVDDDTYKVVKSLMDADKKLSKAILAINRME